MSGNNINPTILNHKLIGIKGCYDSQNHVVSKETQCSFKVKEEIWFLSPHTIHPLVKISYPGKDIWKASSTSSVKKVRGTFKDQIPKRAAGQVSAGCNNKAVPVSLTFHATDRFEYDREAFQRGNYALQTVPEFLNQALGISHATPGYEGNLRHNTDPTELGQQGITSLAWRSTRKSACCGKGLHPYVE